MILSFFLKLGSCTTGISCIAHLDLIPVEKRDWNAFGNAIVIYKKSLKVHELFQKEQPSILSQATQIQSVIPFIPDGIIR